MKNFPDYAFSCKTDVESYYDSINHYTLMMKLHDQIKDRRITGYEWQFLNRCVEWGGLYQDIKRGIPRGSSLSPLLGAFYLADLDHRMKNLDVKYFRYMDDILILAPTRWKLKKAIRVLNQTFNELKLEKHPDKTMIGRTERGFDFLGYHFSPQGLSLAEKTVENFLEKARRIHEQESATSGKEVLSDYVRRWLIWTNSGLSSAPNEEIVAESVRIDWGELGIGLPIGISTTGSPKEQMPVDKSRRRQNNHLRYRTFPSCFRRNDVLYEQEPPYRSIEWLGEYAIGLSGRATMQPFTECV